MTYLIKRGPRARRRIAVAHLARYDSFGEISGAWCERTGFDLTSNVPWGLRRCKDCSRHSSVAANFGSGVSG
jgi:hypothetical protein